MSEKRSISQLVSDSKASIEEICVGRLLRLKAITAFVSEMKSKYDVNGTLDWRTIVGHFADAKATKKKVAKKYADKREGAENTKQNNGKVTKAKISPTHKEITTLKDTPVKPVAQKPPKVKPARTKSPKEEKTEEVIEHSEEPTATTMVDPFFITNDGSNYISTAVIDRTQPDGPENELNRRSRRANRSNINSVASKSHGKNSKFNNPAPKLKSFGGSSRTEARKDVPAAANADVHPSWSAKRKQKSILAFQGKKIKFDGGEDKLTTGITKSTTNDAEDKLHPSWAAKQKLKPVITEFKGSKITFD